MERWIVDRSSCPGVSRQLPAWPVVGLGTENSDRRRIDRAVLGYDIADNVVGKCSDDFVTCAVKSLREVRRSVQSLFFSGVGDEDDRSLEALGEMLREYSGELHHRRCPRSIVVSTRRILCRLESRQRSEIRPRADAGVVVSAHHHNSGSIATRKPCDHVHYVDHWPLRMPAHLHQRRIIFDAEAATACFAIARQLVEQIAASRANATRVARGVTHGVTCAERNEHGVGGADLGRRDLGDCSRERRIALQSHRDVGRRGNRRRLLGTQRNRRAERNDGGHAERRKSRLRHVIVIQ